MFSPLLFWEQSQNNQLWNFEKKRVGVIFQIHFFFSSTSFFLTKGSHKRFCHVFFWRHYFYITRAVFCISCIRNTNSTQPTIIRGGNVEYKMADIRNNDTIFSMCYSSWCNFNLLFDFLYKCMDAIIFAFIYQS